MGCGCKKKQEQPVVQQPPQSINLQNVAAPTVTQPAAPAPPQNP